MKNKCDCYIEEYEFVNYTPLMTPTYKTIPLCYGTKEREKCSCGGDKTKCDFYLEVREKAKKNLDELIITYDHCAPDVSTLCIARREGNKIKVLNTIQGDEAFGMYFYLTGNAELKEKQGKWKLHDDGSGTCDQCNFRQKNVWDYDNWQNYCGCCGAKMSIEEV